jgi:hypothetical protein
MEKRKVLIITSSGGAGLLHAAKAIEQQILSQDSQTIIYKVDLMNNWYGNIIGKFGIYSWNWGMTTGHIQCLKVLKKLQFVAEILLWFKVFFVALIFLIKNKIDIVIDTQPLSIAPIIKAIRCYNYIYKKDVFLEKVISDLPTKECSLFFSGIKYLSKKDKRFLKIISIDPLLEKNQTKQDFWKQHCKVDEKCVKYVPFYIRDSFKKYYYKKRENQYFTIAIKTKSMEEKNHCISSFKKGQVEYQNTIDGVEFPINPIDKVIVLLLGSQPSSTATTSYIESTIDHYKKFPSKNKVYLFAFASAFTKNKKCLYKKVCNLVETQNNYPDNLSIIPMSFQTEEVIASLFFRSDLTITRSAGQTVMELISASRKKHLIHSENQDSTYGMPLWEAGSARYLKEKANATIITPNIFSETCKKFLNFA